MSDPYLYQRNMEREEDRLTEAYNNGDMTLADYNAEMRDLQRGYQDAAEQAAEDERERWFA